MDSNELVLLEQLMAMRRQADGAAAVSQSIAQGAANFLNTLDRLMLDQLLRDDFAKIELIKHLRSSETPNPSKVE